MVSSSGRPSARKRPVWRCRAIRNCWRRSRWRGSVDRSESRHPVAVGICGNEVEMARSRTKLDIAYHGERQPDAIEPVEVDGHCVITYSFGSGDETVLCLSGGPGLSCDYVRDSHCVLADAGYRVVCYDQLGTGASDK